MRGIINMTTIGAGPPFVKFAVGDRFRPFRSLYAGPCYRYNKGSLSAEVAELADA